MFLIDSHCHISKFHYNKIPEYDLENLIYNAKLNHVKLLLTVCTKLDYFHELININKNYSSVLISCGVHPLYINNSYNYHELLNLSSNNNVIAIGETGLDFFYEKNIIKKNKQKIVFVDHILVAKKLNKPIIVHTRNSFKDIINILNNYNNLSGVFHCFNENIKCASLALDIGFYISFSGILTFKNAKMIRETLKYIPLDRLLLETDSPYLTPEPYRGIYNQPAYLKNIVEYVSIIRNIPLKKLSNILLDNFIKLFKINI
ncbi:MAG: YchF/TatD family DNA exonuclease [Candidatus Lightella neohaematopini]|nr:YchF/TatD family DNA exonuclease [Candidatus Lightella neohaematopini]